MNNLIPTLVLASFTIFGFCLVFNIVQKLRQDIINSSCYPNQVELKEELVLWYPQAERIKVHF